MAKLKKPKPRQPPLESLMIAHGTHVDKPDFTMQGTGRYQGENHNFKDHIGYDPSGKPATYMDVPLYNDEGGALPITRNNDGMRRREYHLMNDSMHTVYGFPDSDAGKAEYQKLKEKYGLP
tara:strand:+ start:187 stop:549 length:363 start_codon:yes stop_codon:yes gene_type:complete